MLEGTLKDQLVLSHAANRDTQSSIMKVCGHPDLMDGHQPSAASWDRSEFKVPSIPNHSLIPQQLRGQLHPNHFRFRTHC